MNTICSVFVLIFHCVFGAQHWNQFCDFKCGLNHTVCKYQCNVGASCTYGVEVFDLTDEERLVVLEVHNKYRNLVALGGKSESAANMIALEYDEDLEYVAKCWGKQCTFDHDDCRSTRDHGYVGQNLFIKWYNTDDKFNELVYKDALVKIDNLVDAMDVWYNEVRYVLPEQYGRFHGKPGQSAIGHFTQLVWAKTERIGCSRVVYKSYLRLNMQFICNYGPGGNIVNKPVYEFGRAASRCPNGTEPSAIYPALCSKKSNADVVKIDAKFTVVMVVAIITFIIRYDG